MKNHPSFQECCFHYLLQWPWLSILDFSKTVGHVSLSSGICLMKSPLLSHFLLLKRQPAFEQKCPKKTLLYILHKPKVGTLKVELNNLLGVGFGFLLRKIKLPLKQSKWKAFIKILIELRMKFSSCTCQIMILLHLIYQKSQLFLFLEWNIYRLSWIGLNFTF